MYAASRTCRVLHRSAAEHREALATDPRQSRSTPWQPRARNVLIGSTPRRSKQLLRSRPVASEPSPASRFAPEGSGTDPRLLRSHVSHCRLESGQMSPLAQQTRAGDEAAGESEIGEPEVLYGPPGGCSAIGVGRHFQSAERIHRHPCAVSYGSVLQIRLLQTSTHLDSPASDHCRTLGVPLAEVAPPDQQSRHRRILFSPAGPALGEFPS